jgi:hypothetical protein
LLKSIDEIIEIQMGNTEQLAIVLALFWVAVACADLPKAEF